MNTTNAVKIMKRLNRVQRFLCEYKNAIGTQNDSELEKLQKELLGIGYWDMQFLFDLIENEINKE
jgi:hypothetical protein